MNVEVINHFPQPEIPELEDKRRRFVTQEFFRKVNDTFPLERIYYPGCGEDTLLTGVIPGATVYYVDKNVKSRKDGTFFSGDYSENPFEPNTFDALLLKDLHIKESGFEDQHRLRIEALMRPVKKGGLIIATKYGCKIWEVDIPFLAGSGLVKPTSFAFTPKELAVFQKI